ncbi:VUT family protein [Citrobacter braakii]|uniref:VUT family protein n=1 Tax=Citrobacter braakii TaxID=57706 RepID=UPI001560452E|nr:VUT family protein [Citrobacter braakii]NRF76613.1 VUT family protein [Citrobacter braakii]
MIADIYIAVICAANLLVAHFGPWITPINAFVLVGLDMVLRDILHERYGLIRSVLLSAVAGVISYAINPAAGIIAIASVVAFVAASIANAWVYQLLISKPWLKKSNAGNIAAAAVDSGLFPVIAFGAFMPGIVIGQFMAKVGGGFVWSMLLRKLR